MNPFLLKVRNPGSVIDRLPHACGLPWFRMRERVSEVLESPDGRREDRLVFEELWRPTGFNASVDHRGEAEAPDDGGNAFIVDKGAARVSWKEVGRSCCVCSRRSRVQEGQTVSGISVNIARNEEPTESLHERLSAFPASGVPGHLAVESFPAVVGEPKRSAQSMHIVKGYVINVMGSSAYGDDDADSRPVLHGWCRSWFSVRGVLPILPAHGPGVRV